jgi:Family of unknown function (DUF6165)
MRTANWLTLESWARGLDRLAEMLRSRSLHPAPQSSVRIETSPGDVIDKITILEIKSERIRDPDKLANVRRELDALRIARDRAIAPSESLLALSAELRAVNETIWNIEDEIRICERNGEFGPRFVELARSVYKNNDHRAVLKRKLNEQLGSRIVEEKSHESGDGPQFGARFS